MRKETVSLVTAWRTIPFWLAETVAGTPPSGLPNWQNSAASWRISSLSTVLRRHQAATVCRLLANSRLPSRNEPCARRAQRRPRGGSSCAHLRRFAVRGPIPESGHTSHWCGVCSSFKPAVPILISPIPATSILLEPAAGRRGPCGDTAVVVVLERRHEWPSANEP